MSCPASDSEIQTIFTEMETKMSKSLDSMKHNINGLRTGRATPALLDSIKVEVYGSFTPINQIGSISAPEARLLIVQVWDKSVAKPVEKAIREADLGLNPSTDGNIIRVPIPDLTEERRRELVKKAGEYCEQAKISIRNLRRDTMDILKKLEKDKRISEDLLETHSKTVQKITDANTKKADQLLDEKSKEIMKFN
jgi:ribosome recycling factor